MTAQETFVANGAESTLSSSLSSGATTINVTSTAAFPSVPFYAVIDPDVDASREVILVDSSKTATTFVLSDASKRGQDGTVDTAHSAGAKVVCVPVAALWTDINDRVDGVSTVANAAYTPGGTDVAVADGGTGASTAAAARTNLAVVGTADTSTAGFGFVVDEDDMVSDSATKVPTQQSVKAFVTSQVSGSGAYAPGGADVAVADGGTGASTAAGARTNLAVVGTADTSTVGFGFVVDEDAMTSNSATKVPTQQSVKAYVDAEVGAVAPTHMEAKVTAGAAASESVTWTTPFATTPVVTATVQVGGGVHYSVIITAVSTTGATVQSVASGGPVAAVKHVIAMEAT